MTYSAFLNQFLSGMSDCLAWLKNLFLDYDSIHAGGEGSVLFTNPLIFTIMGISLVTLIIEELIGVLTSFRFGGFFFRRFGRGYGSGYRTKYETEYPKAYETDYSSEHKITPFRSRYNARYFISYNGKYYPFTHSRYNPFYVRQFNSAYKAGRIVSYSEIYGGRAGNSTGGFGGVSHSVLGNNSVGGAYNGKLMKEAFKLGSDWAQNAHDIYKDYKKKHDEKNAPVDEESTAKHDMAKGYVDELVYNENADFESLFMTEGPDATYDGPRPSDMDISVDDD